MFWKSIAHLWLFPSAAGTEEHTDLTRSLSLIKETIVQVDAQVNIHEKNSRLQDIHNKMEPKALGKFKDGRVFRREDLVRGRRRLLHDGTVSWKAASGRLKGLTTRETGVSLFLPAAVMWMCSVLRQIFLQCFCLTFCFCCKRKISDTFLHLWYVNSFKWIV